MTKPFVRSLRRTIAITMGDDNAKLSVVAARLGTSARTIQRRLGELGLKYSSLREDVRREQALHLVTHGRMSMAEVAAALGYRDAGSFTRAFRRWTGAPPFEYRRNFCRMSPAPRARARAAGAGMLAAGAKRQESAARASIRSGQK